MRWLGLQRQQGAKVLLVPIVVLGMSACGGGGGLPEQPATLQSSSSATANSEATTTSSSDASSSSSVPAMVTDVSLRGTVTYDSVRPQVNGNQVFLDYANVLARPARGVTVQLLDSLNTPIAETTADEQGRYAFTVSPDRSVKVRVKAELVSSNYSVFVRDNTQSNAQYVLDGSLAGSGSSAVQTRDLHADLGWNMINLSYTSERQSAPFAIADALYDSLQMVVEADPSVSLPPLDVFWSTRNVASRGDFSLGNIGSSLYSTGASAIYILGHANNDTDEFDNTVVQHEFGHFIEDKLSRSESIGGAHFLGAPIDMRVAFGEGFGNAFALMSSGGRLYLDTSGVAQQSGFGFDIETNRFGGGYYSEGAIQSILYNLFDANNENADNISLGFGPILAALRHEDYVSFDGFTSIFPFVSSLKSVVPESAAQIDELLLAERIVGTGPYGEGETATGSIPFSLPIYQRLTLGGSVRACSDNVIQEYNGLGVRRFVLLEVPSSGRYTLEAVRVSGIQPSDPDFQMYRQGRWVGSSEGPDPDRETWARNFNQGVYALSVYDAFNTDQLDSTGGNVCFDVTFN